jgi:hypothetical protein
MVEVCTGAHVRRWAAQAKRLAKALNTWRATMVSASKAAGDASIAGKLVSSYAAWFQSYSAADKEPHWAGLGNAERAQELATLVQDGACILAQMQQETERLQPGAGPQVDPGPPAPGPSPGLFNDPFAVVALLAGVYLLIQSDLLS